MVVTSLSGSEDLGSSTHQNIPRSSKGRTSRSGRENWGSNPCLGAIWCVGENPSPTATNFPTKIDQISMMGLGR